MLGKMSATRFIARRLTLSGNQRSFSHVIIRIAIASVALSVAVMIIASAMITGFKKEISQKIFDFWGHIQITDAFTNPILETRPIPLDQALLDSLLSIDQITYEDPLYWGNVSLWPSRIRTTKGGVKQAYPYIQYPAILSTGEDMEGILLKGLSTDGTVDFFSRYLVHGRGLEADDEDRSLIISQMTANRMLLQVGDPVILHFVRDGRPVPRRFEIKGIYKTGLAEYDRRVAFLDLRHLQEILGWGEEEVSGVEVILDDIDDLEIIDAYIYQEVLPVDRYTQTIRQRASSIFDWLDLQNTNEIIILGLMLVVCIINMITALLILILERIHMIGILKALGADNWLVRRIFIIQAARILAWGLIIGNSLGLLLCWAQKKFEFIRLQEEDYYLAVAPIHIDFWLILVINAGTLLISVLFLILPSYFVSRIAPTRAIRFT